MNDLQASVKALIETIELLAQLRPHVVDAIAQAARNITRLDLETQIFERLHRCSEDELAVVEALTAHFEQRRRAKIEE